VHKTDGQIQGALKKLTYKPTMDVIKLNTQSPNPPTPKKVISNIIRIGHRYMISGPDSSVLNSTHGVCGNYRIGVQCAEILPVAPITTINDLSECYFWDTDIHLSELRCGIKDSAKDKLLSSTECALGTNRLVLNKVELTGPEIKINHEKAALILSPRFNLTFSTDCYAAQLGVINLVQATRFIMLDNGDKINLLDTGDEETPVLYLENPQDDQVIKYIAEPQDLGVTQQHTFGCDVSQLIPDEVVGSTVATVTVLEQYWSYFMQRALPLDVPDSIWTPVYAPVSWGWSIRVGRRTDGEWGILRRKLILPTVGHEGFQLPTWTNNSVACSALLEL
jgi:hypothetical protein